MKRTIFIHLRQLIHHILLYMLQNLLELLTLTGHPANMSAAKQLNLWALMGGTHSQWASRVSSLMAFDMPILPPPAGVSQWVAGPTTPVVC